MGSMSLALSGCPGGVVIGWSPISNPTFAKYRTLRSASAEHSRGVPAAERRRGGGDGQVGDDERRQRLRLVGYARRDLVLPNDRAERQRRGHRHLRRRLRVDPGRRRPGTRSSSRPDAGGTRFSWTPFTGAGTMLHVLQARLHARRVAPSYLEGDPYLLASGDQAQATHVSADLVSGQTYTLRLQVIRGTDTGAFLVAQSDVATYTAP